MVQIYIFTAKPVSCAWWGVTADYRCRYGGWEVVCDAQETGLAPVRQMSARPTLVASPVTLTAISSSNLPSFTWTSQIIIKKTKTNYIFQCLVNVQWASAHFLGKWFVLSSVIINDSKNLCLKSQLCDHCKQKTLVKCKHIDANVKFTLKDKVKEFHCLLQKSHDRVRGMSTDNLLQGQTVTITWRALSAVSIINTGVFVHLVWIWETVAYGSLNYMSSKHLTK